MQIHLYHNPNISLSQDSVAFARGAKRFQQMEILLVLENNVAEDEAFDFIIDNIITDIYMEIPIFFYLDVMNPEMLKLAIEHPMPRFRQIQKEGIVFYGQDLLRRVKIIRCIKSKSSLGK